jgi:uncharacterized protein
LKLIDVNVLVYAIDSGSEHHERSRSFVEAALSSDELVALPWPVLTGVIRTLSNRALKQKMATAEVLAIVDEWLTLPNVVTLEPGPQHWPIFREMLEAGSAFGNLTYDAHLAALAVANGAELCSADSDFARFPRLKWTDPTRPS